MSDADAKKAAAERQRRARARRRASALVARVQVDVGMTETLIALGLLHPWKDDDREAIGRALEKLLHRHVASVTRDAT